MTKADLVKLISRAQKGDSESMERLCRFLKKEIELSVFHMIGNRQTAEDLIQETYLQLIKSFAELKDPVKIKSFTAQITIRTINRHLRKRYQWKDLISNDNAVLRDPPANGSASNNSIEDKLLNKISIEQLIEHVDGETNRKLLFLKMQGKNYREIAEELSLTEASVKMRFKRTAATLREKLERYPS